MTPTMRRTVILLLSAAAFSTSGALKLRVPAELDPCAAVDCASGLVCTLVTPQSCNVAPCPKTPVCLPKNQTCDTNSCAADETCVLRAVTCIMAPCYPIKECAKFPKCGANEEYNECSLNGPCEPNCKQAFPICSNVTCGSGACECKTGYYRHNGTCITRDQCPTPTCAKPNEEWNTCPSACPQTCRILRGVGVKMMCPAVCGAPACTCAAGFVRDDDWNCVKADDCPSNSTSPTRPIPADHDVSASAENSGENSSENGPSCDRVRCEGNTACSLKGKKAVCVKCKKNEKIDPCPNACAQQSCEDGGIMRKCVAIKMCGPQACVCADGYVRNMRSGECVKRDKCPKGDNSTMHILPMPANPTEPLILPFPESNDADDEAILTKPLTLLPFFPPTDEAVHIMPVDELVDPIPRNWTRPAPRPAHPQGTNATDDMVHILPMPEVDPIPRNWTRPMRPQVLPIFVKENSTVHFANGTVISVPYVPQFNGSDNDTMHILPFLNGTKLTKPLVDPIPANWTRPAPRPQIMPLFENGTAHILPFLPRDDGSVHIMPVTENGTMISLPYVPHFNGSNSGSVEAVAPNFGNDTMHILPANWTRPLIRPFPGFNRTDNGTMHIMPLIDHIPSNWSRPAPRPAHPPKDEAVHIMPFEDLVDPIPRNWSRPAPRPFFPPGTNATDDMVHILPMPELVDPIPRNRTRPMHPQVMPIFTNWTKPLIRPAFPDNSTEGTAHILPILYPIPANWSRPAPRPFFPPGTNGTDGTAHILPHFGHGTIISGPYVPNFNGSNSGSVEAVAPNFGNDTMHILPFPGHGAVHVQPVRENGTMSILPFFPAGNDSVSGGNGTVHIMPFFPTNPTTDVCANHTCPAGHWCEETPVMCIRDPCPPIATCVSTSPRGGARDQPSCGKGEEYSDCAPACPETCRGVSECTGKPQPLVCKAGCVCKNKFKRDAHGVCVQRHKCWKTAGCQANEIWHKCRTCEPTCTESNEVCTAQCVSGCGCDDGFVRGPSGACIEQKKCPKTTTPGPTTTTAKASGSRAPSSTDRVSGSSTTSKAPSTTTHKA